MSNALAVASVSWVLVDLLNNGLIDRDISSTGVGDVTVTALPPDRVDAMGNITSMLNLFLYNITQNPGWRNVNLPSRDAAGNPIANPPLPLDLHFLLTAYGAQPFHSEILLGYGMQLLHETPTLSRDAIRKSLSAPTQVAGGGGLPGGMLNLYTSQLAEQVEQIKISPQTLTTEEISRLWTAFQAKYRPTAAYQVSVVLIQSQAPFQSALPVRRRTVRAIPMDRPVIATVASQANSGAPIVAGQPILPGYNLVIQGSQLQGDQTSVLISGSDLTPSSVTPSQAIVTLPPGLAAGTQTVQISQSTLLGIPPVPHAGVSSNVATFVLSPVIQNVTASAIAGSGTSPRSGNLNLTVAPPVWPQQAVTVKLNPMPGSGMPPMEYSFPAPPLIDLASPPSSPPPATSTLSVPFSGVVAGSYLVRVQVAGADSPLGVDGTGKFSTPAVTIA